MEIRIALAGNPNSGKTTLFNALTGSNQFVGNWPGVTVEKKEGRLKSHPQVVIADLPGIYSLSPYTLEEVVARNYLLSGQPDVILNIVDGTNIERNLYLTTQLTEIGIPVVIAINMMDIVRKSGDLIDIVRLSRKLGCQIIEISALKNTGISEAAQAAIAAVKAKVKTVPQHRFNGAAERALAKIEQAAKGKLPVGLERWYAVKLFERDPRAAEQLRLPPAAAEQIESAIAAAEAELDDDAESIITNDRYNYITTVLGSCYERANPDGMSVSDKIDRVVTNRFAALPIFALIMFAVYFISVTTVGGLAADWANNGVFGQGWHLFGIGSAAYESAESDYELTVLKAEAFENMADASGLTPEEAADLTAAAVVRDDAGNAVSELSVTYADYLAAKGATAPDPGSYGIWIPGIPVLISRGLTAAGCADWLSGLILGGIVSGVGAVLGFVPQMMVLFLSLAFLEACGYMSRIAFVMDKLFRKFGLSGKSFIPILIGTGCGVPGIMASRTIENDRDRKMTIITTTFIPCGAKLPMIALIAGALFGGEWWVAPSAYFAGICAIVLSGILLKKTSVFAGSAAPFVMELPAYHMPLPSNVLHSMWERAWSFIKKAGTIILLAAIFLWFTSNFGFVSGRLEMVPMEQSVLALIGGAIAWIFTPLGWGTWQPAVAAITGLMAKENIVGTFGVLYGGLSDVSGSGWQIWENLRTAFTPLAGYSFLLFNLLCAPCFAAVGAIRREMNSWRWTLFAVGYQTLFAYGVSLCVYQFGLLFSGAGINAGTFGAVSVLILFLYLLLRPAKTRESVRTAERQR